MTVLRVQLKVIISVYFMSVIKSIYILGSSITITATAELF